MPAAYHPVAPAVWDRAMRSLSPEAKLVRLYVLTCPTRVSEGLFALPLGHAAHDLGLDVETVMLALEELDAAGLVSYDRDAEVVLDRTALRFTPLKMGRNKRTGEPTPDSRIAGALRQYANVPASPLKLELMRLAREHSWAFYEALADANPVESAWSFRDVVAPPTGREGGVKGTSRAEQIRARDSGVQRLVSDSAPLTKTCAHCPAFDRPAGTAPDGSPLMAFGSPWCGECSPHDVSTFSPV